MVLPIAALVIGALLITKGFTGATLSEIINGELPEGAWDNSTPGTDSFTAAVPGLGDSAPQSTASSLIPGLGNIVGAANPGVFKGPNALRLEALRVIAVVRFGLRITDTCRPQNASYGAPKSMHKQCRAIDAAGSAKQMAAFAKYAKSQKWVANVFYDPLGWVAPGYSHGDHVHVDA